LFLDPNYKDYSGHAPTTEEARTWFRDYLRCIYQEFNRFFDETYPYWRSENVDFVFSVPTTWKDPAMVAQIEKLIKEAGFAETPRQHVKISLTEAEAAAVYAAKHEYREGDVFLVCDAGGGTTDINMLKLITAGRGRGKMELRPLSCVQGKFLVLSFNCLCQLLGWPPLRNFNTLAGKGVKFRNSIQSADSCIEGIAVGSTIIDFKVQKMIEERLRTISGYLEENTGAISNLRIMSEKMMRGRFEHFKCSFGREASNIPVLPLTIPDLRPGLDFPQACVENSRMLITRYVL
jgi:hypothetical protein